MQNTTKTLVAPSLLAADFSQLATEISAIEQAGAQWLHLDVMDGHFVPNISFGAPLIKSLRPHSKLFFDVHLMISPVDCYLEDFAAAGADLISFHIEATPHAHRTVSAIHELGKKAGIVLNPATPAIAVAEILPLVDLVLVMSVNPGFGGQSFITGQLRKIRQLRHMIDELGLEAPPLIQVDGGINSHNAQEVITAGADILVAGSAVFGHDSYSRALQDLGKFLPDSASAPASVPGSAR